MATANLTQLELIAGADKLSLYQWNTRIAKHYFCSICGIYTHHQRRSAPNEFGFNVACIDGIDIADLGEIPTTDGSSMSLTGEDKH